MKLAFLTAMNARRAEVRKPRRRPPPKRRETERRVTGRMLARVRDQVAEMRMLPRTDLSQSSLSQLLSYRAM